MKPKSSAWSGLGLILVGVLMGGWGLIVISQGDGGVSGGPIIWVMYFGGSLVFVVCGAVSSIKALSRKHNIE